MNQKQTWMRRALRVLALLGLVGVGGAWGQVQYSMNNGCFALGNEANIPVAWTATCRDGLIDGLGVFSFIQPREQVDDTSKWHQKVLMINAERTGVALGIRDPNMIGALYVSSWPILRLSLFKNGKIFEGKVVDQVARSARLQDGLASAKLLFSLAESQNIPTQPWFEIEKTIRLWFANPRISAQAFGASPAGVAPFDIKQIKQSNSADDTKVFGRSARGG